MSGTIPSELGKLTNLEGLYLYSNQLKIPSELGNLTQLGRVVPLGQQLSGTIPSELGKLTNLEAVPLRQPVERNDSVRVGQCTNLEG